MSDTTNFQTLAQALAVLAETREVLWQLAEEDGDLERNADRWNQSGEGYALLDHIAVLLPPLEALRAASSSH